MTSEPDRDFFFKLILKQEVINILFTSLSAYRHSSDTEQRINGERRGGRGRISQRTCGPLLCWGGSTCLLLHVRSSLACDRNTLDEESLLKRSTLGHCRWRKKMKSLHARKEPFQWWQAGTRKSMKPRRGLPHKNILGKKRKRSWQANRDTVTSVKSG